MTEEQRKVFEKAFDTLDRVKEQQAIWDAEREAETPFQKMDRQNAEADAYLAELQQRRIEQQPEPVKPQPKASAMTDADRQWVIEKLELMVGVIGGEVWKMDNKLRVEIIARRDQIWADIAALREEMGQLRAAVTLLEAHKVSKSDVSEGSIMSTH